MSDQNDTDREETASSANILPDDYVPVYDSPDYETGEVICATLAAQGLHAVMQNPTLGPAANVYPALGLTWSHAVYVPPDEVEAARSILSAQQPTEEELAAEQAADPTTLEEAEANIKNA